VGDRAGAAGVLLSFAVRDLLPDGRFRWRIRACCIRVEPCVRRVLVDGVVI
jgi:hypothetical protein